MFDNIIKFFKKFGKEEKRDSKDTAKERLHLVLMQDRANVSADFLELMKQEIIEVIKKYIDVDENSIDVRLTNKDNGDGTTGAPALYANIPIVSIKDETRKINIDRDKEKQTTSKDKENIEKEEAKKEEIEKEDKVNTKEEVEEKKINKKAKVEETKKEVSKKEEQKQEETKEDDKKQEADNNENEEKEDKIEKEEIKEENKEQEESADNKDKIEVE